MNIALDYDGTYTNDPDLWLAFVDDAVEKGHQVTVVTMRYPSEATSLDPRLMRLLNTQGPLVRRLVCTSRAAKQPYCQVEGLQIHVWIDDNPKAIHMSAQEVWGSVSPEGQVVDPVYPVRNQLRPRGSTRWPTGAAT